MPAMAKPAVLCRTACPQDHARLLARSSRQRRAAVRETYSVRSFAYLAGGGQTMKFRRLKGFVISIILKFRIRMISRRIRDIKMRHLIYKCRIFGMDQRHTITSFGLL